MGVEMEIELLRHGFYPAGGGEVRASVKPVAKLLPLDLRTRGEWLSSKAIAVIAGVPRGVAQRELERLSAQFGVIEQSIRGLPSNEGPGNALMVELCYEHVTEVFTSFGKKGLSAEVVADRVAKNARLYRDGIAVAGEHLADQLLLPMALAGGGCFTTLKPTPHLHTNAEVIMKFLPVAVAVVVEGDGVVHRVTVTQ